MGRKMITLICPDCGKIREDTLNNYERRGHSLCNSCSRMKNYGKDYIGKTFGRATIVSDAEPAFGKKGDRRQMVNCVCSCGQKFVARRRGLFSGDTVSCGCFTKERMKNSSGEKHPRYNHDLTIEEREELELLRQGAKTRNWRNSVRSYGKCVICGSTQNLVAHHLEGFKDNPELRFDENNGKCVCAKCHIEYHTKFMGGYSVPATAVTFDEFARIKNGE